MSCDACSVEFKLCSKSLKNATSHYKKEHQIIGYLKCCGLKLKQDVTVNDHIKWHQNPNIFK